VLNDGTNWIELTFTEITISLSGCTASRPYDVFLYISSGTVAAETLIWTNATTRATALTTSSGVLVKTGDVTRRYVGTFYCNASGGQTDDSLAKRYIWNYYNRVPRALRRLETTANWTYNTNTYRQANAATANQLDVVVGWAEVVLGIRVYAANSNGTAGTLAYTAIGEDSTSAAAAGTIIGVAPSDPTSASNPVQMVAELEAYPAVGRHFYVWLEKAAVAAGATTFYGVSGSDYQTGMVGWIEG
jgi:hypothetical protein